jgi:hypothetical protein
LVTDWAPRPPEPEEVETGVLPAAAGVDAVPPAEVLAAGDELELLELELQPATASAAAASAATA